MKQTNFNVFAVVFYEIAEGWRCLLKDAQTLPSMANDRTSETQIFISSLSVHMKLNTQKDENVHIFV